MTRRAASLASLAVLLAAWCVLTYVQVERNGVMEPLVKAAFLPAPDAVLKSLFYLVFEKDLLGALAISGVRILKAFALSIVASILSLFRTMPASFMRRATSFSP